MTELPKEFTTAACSFPGSSNTYTYKVPPWCKHVKKRSLAVVETNNGYKIVQVARVHKTAEIDPKAGYEYKWLVDIIDTTNYLDLRRLEVLQKQMAHEQADSWLN